MPGRDPSEILYEMANDANEKSSLRAHCAAELMRYLYPQLKAIEHSGPGGGPIEIHDSAREEFARRISGLAARLDASGDIKRPE